MRATTVSRNAIGRFRAEGESRLVDRRPGTGRLVHHTRPSSARGASPLPSTNRHMHDNKLKTKPGEIPAAVKFEVHPCE